MTIVDQFESVFRSAVKEKFKYNNPDIKSILIVCDKTGAEADNYFDTIKIYLNKIFIKSCPTIDLVTGNEYETAHDLDEICRSKKPDLICTYRNLHTKAWKYKYSLGTHLDVLLQVAESPVLVLPHPDAGYIAEHALKNNDCVMAVTDNLTADDRLVNYSVSITAESGKLYLVHIENKFILNRYIDAISKITSINTDEAKLTIEKQLLKEPDDYINSCKESIEELLNIKVEPIVDSGHHINLYKEIIATKKIDLLVMNTKDDEQLAMHRVAYPLAIELRQIPILML